MVLSTLTFFTWYLYYVLPYDALDSVWTLSSESALKGVSRRNRSFSVPKEGRLEDLKMAFATVNPTSKGKRKDLRVSFKEDEQNFLNEYLPLQTEGHARYNPPSSQEGSALKAPWPVAFYLEVEEIDGKCDEDGKPVWEPDESTFIGWAVALHRFLVKQWGIDPSPMLIGKYAPGIDRPANNVAIQIFDSALKNQYAHELREDISEMGPGFLIMVPRNMPQSDIQRLQNIELSPETVIFGGWDSTRSKNQLRIPSVLVGETYGVLSLMISTMIAGVVMWQKYCNAAVNDCNTVCFC